MLSFIMEGREATAGYYEPGSPDQGFCLRGCSTGGAGGAQGLEVDVRPRAGSTAVCSGYMVPHPGYDSLSPGAREET